MISQSIGAYTDATHGMTLSAVSMAYYRFIMPYGLAKFRRFAVNVWEVNPERKERRGGGGRGAWVMERYMRELGLVMDIRELGVTEELDGIAAGTIAMDGGYRAPDHGEIYCGNFKSQYGVKEKNMGKKVLILSTSPRAGVIRKSWRTNL